MSGLRRFFHLTAGAAGALILAMGSAQADAIPLTLHQEPAHTVGPQSTSAPCVIAATTCQQPGTMAYDNYTQKGSIPAYNELSPIYSVGQLSGFGLSAFNVAIDVNTTGAQGETLQSFDVLIGGLVAYSFTGPSLIGTVSSNGNGYGDWTLQSVNLAGLGADTSVQFHAVWNNASDGGESFFLVAANPVPGPVVGAGIPGLVMAFGGAMAWWRRRKAIATA